MTAEPSAKKDEGVNDDQLLPPPQSWFRDYGEETSDGQDTTQKPNEIDLHATQHYGFHERPLTPQQETSYTTPNPANLMDSQSVSELMSSVGKPQKAPTWKELSCQVLPAAAKELLSTSLQRVLYTARLSFAFGRWYRHYSDLGNPVTGYFHDDLALPPFSSLSWIDRQLVWEWRTIVSSEAGEDDEDDDDLEFERARTLIPQVLPKPQWQKADMCQTCRKPFGPALLRHHCRLCGQSFCQNHSDHCHKLPQFGYDPDVPERVCGPCKRALNDQNLAERIAWRLARCRDYFSGDLTPYFETGVDTVEDAALRITKAALAMARSVPLGAQAHVAMETVEVLRKYGLKGVYGLILRKEFLAAADLLCRALGINKTSWPLSVHELSAAIFYALAQHRAVRGMNPEHEHRIHALRQHNKDDNILMTERDLGEAPPSPHWTKLDSSDDIRDRCDVDENDIHSLMTQSVTNLEILTDAPKKTTERKESTDVPRRQLLPVCDPVPDSVLSSVLVYAPIALNFIYSERDVDMQLLAAQQGWRLLYSHLDQEPGSDRPGSALFVHEERRVACFAVRGTATINDVVTDIRQMPVPFPEPENDLANEPGDWASIFRGQGLAVCGMARAAVNLYREHIGVLMLLIKEGYRVRITGHSLGGGVATLLGTLVLLHLEKDAPANLQPGVSSGDSDLIRVYGFGTPACVDAELSDHVKSFVTTVVLHDDVVPRLTPTSIRELLKHLLRIRETWVKAHLKKDLMAITERAKTAWAPRWRSGFTLGQSSFQKYCHKQIQYGRRKLLSVKGKFVQKVTHSVGSKDGLSSWSSPNDEDRECNPKDDDQGLQAGFVKSVNSDRVGIRVDGDEFFDTSENLLEDEDDDDMLVTQEAYMTRLMLERSSVSRLENEATQTFIDSSEHEYVSRSETHPLSSSELDSLEESDEPSSAVVLDETPLPRMYLPGNIIHIYTHRGGYKATYVPRSFRGLRRISMAGNMLSDHTCKAYYEALLEVQTIRSAQEGLPRWTAFDEDDTCSCCASRFTWASTSDSEAQEARDKHNCRSCGTLVCDPCSKNRIPIPSIGLTVPVRVCDRCYNDIAGLHSGQPTTFLSTSVLANDDRNSTHITHHFSNLMSPSRVSPTSAKMERTRERRSLVVDELASRVHCCS